MEFQGGTKQFAATCQLACSGSSPAPKLVGTSLTALSLALLGSFASGYLHQIFLPAQHAMHALLASTPACLIEPL